MIGLEVQQKLNEAGVHIPIIFITGHGDIPMTVKAMKSGAVEFLTKPFRDQLGEGTVKARSSRARANLKRMMQAKTQPKRQSLL
jgi:FixJ family two-component response regulator